MDVKYKITQIDEEKGHVTFQVIIDGSVVQSDTRCDLPINDVDAVKAELERYAQSVSADYVGPEVDPKLEALVGKAQEVVVEEPAVEPAEV